ncbi:AfsR/SARP family transcriptional regulator [Amycolatopsis sp. NPDC098790]|uniref:AfsR/SARP family transcriptional regulator n=1 Tax=Amycolatopsis sp. NPDC098790 TaxID=3363939 RepID=UPI0037F5B76A
MQRPFDKALACVGQKTDNRSTARFRHASLCACHSVSGRRVENSSGGAGGPCHLCGRGRRMEITFGILGQTTMRVHGNLSVRWTHRRERNVVAALLTQPGRRMSIDTLVDWAWNDDEERPRAPKGALYKCVGRIRQALGQAGAPAKIVAISGGYQLEIDPELIDFHAFRSAMRRAHELSDRDEHREACETARAALALWRDEPLAGITSEPARNWRASVTANYWVPANTFLLSELLTVGRPDEALLLLDELSHECATELWFAKLRLQSLTAVGRYAARNEYYLDAYRYFRRIGDDQAAEDLRALQEHLRAPEPLAAGADPGPAERPYAPPAPLGELPRDVAGFTGRAGVLADLDAALTPAGHTFVPTVVAVTGPPGVGKTSTVVHWARRAAARFPGGVMLIDLHGVGPAPRVEPADVVGALLSALNYPVDQIVGAAGRAARLRSLLGDRPMLIVLDNAEDTAHIEPLLGVLSDCAVIVTARRRLKALARRHQCPILTLAPLSAETSAELIRRRLGDRSMREPEAVANLASLCNGFPLALTIVAERAASRAGSRLQTVVEQLRDPATLLRISDDGDGEEMNLYQVFSWSYQCLESLARHVFRVFGLHPGPEAGVEALASAAGVSVAEGRRALDLLVAAHLVQQPGDGDRYRMHDLFHHFARALNTPGTPVDGPRRRMVSYYLHTAHNAHRIVHPNGHGPKMPPVEPGCRPDRFTDPLAAMRWCLRERANLTTMVKFAAEHGLHELAWRFPHVTGGILNRFGYFDDVIAGLTIAVRSAGASGDDLARMACLNDLGYIHLLTGHDAVAEIPLRQALELATAHAVPFAVVTVKLNMGHRHRHAGRLGQAAALYEECAVAAREIGDDERQAKAEHNLAKTLAELDQPYRALEHLRRALLLRRDLADAAALVETHTELVGAYTDLAEFDSAHAHCREAIPLLEKVRDLSAVMRLHTARAQLALAEGRLDDALGFANEAVVFAERSRTATGEARALTALGHVLARRGDLEPARTAWNRAAGLYRDRERHRRAERVERYLTELGAATEIPDARISDEDTVSLPAPPRRRSS